MEPDDTVSRLTDEFFGMVNMGNMAFSDKLYPVVFNYILMGFAVGYDLGIEHSRPRTSKPVTQMDKFGVIVGKYKSMNQAARTVGKNVKAIYDCCNGKQNSAYGFYWRYTNE